MEAKAVLLAGGCHILTILRHQCAKLADLLEEASFYIEVAAAGSPRTNEFEHFDFQVALQMNVVDDEQDLLVWVCWNKNIFALVDVLFLNLKAQALHCQVGCHGD